MLGLCRQYWGASLQGTDVTDEELLEYISESSTMSKAMDEYDGESPRPAFQHQGWSPFISGGLQDDKLFL